VTRGSTHNLPDGAKTIGWHH